MTIETGTPCRRLVSCHRQGAPVTVSIVVRRRRARGASRARQKTPTPPRLGSRGPRGPRTSDAEPADSFASGSGLRRLRMRTNVAGCLAALAAAARRRESPRSRWRRNTFDPRPHTPRWDDLGKALPARADRIAPSCVDFEVGNEPKRSCSWICPMSNRSIRVDRRRTRRSQDAATPNRPVLHGVLRFISQPHLPKIAYPDKASANLLADNQ